MKRSLWLFALLLGSLGCGSYTALRPEDRHTLNGHYAQTAGPWFLKLSYYITPFFGDDSKKLLTPLPPEQVRLLEKPDGTPISPGAVEQVLPAGTRVRISQIEFPTSWNVTERGIYTPRTQPWVYLSVEGEPKTRPYILVLRPEIKSQDEFHAEIQRYLVERNPQERLASWSESIREAVRTKSAVTDMPAEALEMAWGYPERKFVEYDDSVRKETWFYPGKKRIAHLRDGRVERLEDR